MLPVAPPQYTMGMSNNDYGQHQGGQHPHDHSDYMGPPPPYGIDPIDTSPLEMEDYQDSNNHHGDNTPRGMDGYHQEMQADNNNGNHNNSSSSMDNGLEAIRNQKIQEFREALEMDLELKRQQAQRVLEEAERLKWQKLLDFQQALQREFAQSGLQLPQHLQQQYHQQQLYMSQQQPFYPQTPTQQYNMGSASHQMYQQQQHSQQHSMSLPPTPLHQHHIERFGTPLRQRQPQHQQPPESPVRPYQQTSPLRQYYQQQSSPRRQTQPQHQQQSSPMRQPQHQQGSSMYQQQQQQFSRGDYVPSSPTRHQGIGSYTNSNTIQYNDMGQPVRQQHGTGGDRRSSPLRQSGMTSPVRQQQQQGTGYSSYDRNQAPSTPLQSPPYNREHVIGRSPGRHRTETPGAYHQQHPNRANASNDIFRTRGAPETFTFDEQDEEGATFRRSHIPGAKSAGLPGSLSRQTPSRDGIFSSSTWNHRISTRHSEPPPRQRELLDEAELLEQEYAQLTGKKLAVPSRSKTLTAVKKAQEERRLKLEALTARVVQNRRRLAHEMDNADRPIVISFEEQMAREMENEERRFDQARDESRQDRHSPSRRRQQMDARDERREELAVVDEAEEPSESVTGTGLEASSESEQIGHGRRGRRGYKSDTVTSSDEIDGESDSDEKITRDFAAKKMPSHQKKGAESHKDRKGKKNADDFVDRLRQKRSEALDQVDRDKTPTRAFSRDKMLEALQVGKSPVTLPERDPKLARKNRKLSSQRLRDTKDNTNSRGRAARIATKKSKATAKEELKQAVARDLGLNDDTDASVQGDNEDKKQRRSKSKTAKSTNESSESQAYSNWKKSQKKSKSEANHHPQLEENRTGLIDNRTTERQKHRESSALSLVSELSESMYGGVSHTSAAVDNDGSDNDEQTGKCYTKESETTSSVNDDTNFDSFKDGAPRRVTGVLGLDAEADEDAEEIEQMKIKVRELVAGSVSEGFEVEDLKSIYSRSAHPKKIKAAAASTKKMPKHTSKKASRLDEPMTNVEALQELERRLDEQDRRKLLPDLLELTQLYGWDLKKLLKHFVHFMPQDSGLDELSLQHLLQIPMKAIQNEDFTSKFAISTRRNHGSHRKAPPPAKSPERRNPSSSGKTKPDKVEHRDSKSGGWRSRVQREAESRSTSSSGDNNDDTIDMGDVRSSLKNLQKRNKRAARRAYTPELQSLDEISS